MEILNLIIKIVAMLLAIYVLPELKAWLAEKVGEKRAEQLTDIIDTFVTAAQQTLKDSAGAERKEYVLEQLANAGIEVTDHINALIEQRVFTLHNFFK